MSVLRGAPLGEFVVWMGIKCSTFVSISQPSCGRSYLAPLGYDTQCIELSNAMVGRRPYICMRVYLHCNFVDVRAYAWVDLCVMQEHSVGMAGYSPGSHHDSGATW